MDHIRVIEAVAARPEDTQGRLIAGPFEMMCAFGRSGLTRSKTEGDGATPVGTWPLRRLYRRPDRPAAPDTELSIVDISADQGWCDDPGHEDYNRLVRLPFPASHEKLWRDDALYDLMIPLGYNDTSIVAGKGSAIFFHLARGDYQPTEGCVAISEADMRTLLPRLSPQTRMIIRVADDDG